MLGRAIVPERHRVRPPLEATLEFRRLDVAIEHLEQGVALGLAQLRDPEREAAIDVEPLPAGHRMGAHDRVLGVGEFHLVAVRCLHAIVMRLGTVVQGGQALQHRFHRLRQGLVGAVHVGEQRVAATVGRYLGEIEDRAHRRLDVARHVGMPFLAGHVPRLLVGLDDQDLGMLREHDGRVGMDMQRAEAAAEVLVLVDRHLLVAEEDHQVLHQRVVHFLELLVAERLGEVDAEDLRANGRRELAHFDGLVGHFCFLRCREDIPPGRRAAAKSRQNPYCGLTTPSTIGGNRMSFRALVLTQGADRKVSGTLETLDESKLPAGDVTVAVEYSTLNYKDGLVLTSGGGLVKTWPHVGGIDFAGTVEKSENTNFKPGDKVVLNGYRVGELHWGGYATKARVKGDWLVKLPAAISAKRAMAIGTAGYTSMLCVMALEKHGITPAAGEILVTGAAGGVGSVAVAILAKLGYAVVAATGRPAEGAYLKALGATTIMDRKELTEAPH